MDDLNLSRYAVQVRTLMAKLLLLISVLLMPLGMTAAPAAVSHDHAATMPMQHCPEQGSTRHSKGAMAECTMACSSALPAIDRIQERPVPYVALFVPAAAVHELRGLHPETATPPPRIA